jgi:hypothetical protein
LNGVEIPAPAFDLANQAVSGQLPDAVPHLSSPDNLPPGATDQPTQPSQPNLTYLRELWHAVQTQEISGNEALLALAQRPLTSSAPPSMDLPNPNAPATPDAVAPIPTDQVLPVLPPA